MMTDADPSRLMATTLLPGPVRANSAAPGVAWGGGVGAVNVVGVTVVGVTVVVDATVVVVVVGATAW